jgi:ubiquitin carboxyl-terminal hydrolase L5
MSQPLPEVDQVLQPKSAELNSKQDMANKSLTSPSDVTPAAGSKEQSPSPNTSAGQTSVVEAAIQPDSPSSKKRALPDSCTTEEPKTKKAKEPLSEASSSNSMPEALSDQAVNKETWQGFCEIESEPAYFSAILRDAGVQGVTVREVFAMTPDLLDMLPQPIYGLVLLFRYREFGNERQATDCPRDVWFANQLPAQNSCGTLAMINILMNNPEIEVGEHLSQFKDFTRDMTPFQRGEAFASFDFVKKIHNSFAKHMDILENDKHLSYKVKHAERLKEQAIKSKNKPTKSRSRRHSDDSASSNASAESFEENSHHFIAFVPVGTEVWKLDGMDAQPTSIGSFDSEAGETWLSTASDTINTLMSAGDDDYGVVALAQSPLSKLRKKAALTINTVAHVDSRLDTMSETWRSFADEATEPTSPRLLGVEQLLPLHPVPAHLKAQIDAEALGELLDRHNALVQELGGVAGSIMEEMSLEAVEEEKANQRKFDCGPAIKVWLEMLAENGYLEANLKRFM